MTAMPTDGRALFSTANADGTLAVSLVPQQLAPLGDDELLVRIEATPINPSDLGLLFDSTPARSPKFHRNCCARSINRWRWRG